MRASGSMVAPYVYLMSNSSHKGIPENKKNKKGGGGAFFQLESGFSVVQIILNVITPIKNLRRQNKKNFLEAVSHGLYHPKRKKETINVMTLSMTIS